MKYKIVSFILVISLWLIVGFQPRQVATKEFIFLTSDHIKLPVKVSGNGFPCMFVPGGPGGGFRSFEQMRGSNLESFMRMIYMDQRGSGSAQTAKDYSIDRVIKDMDEVRGKLHIDKMYLLSHSFGGILLVNYARKYPQHVAGLILVNSTLHFFSSESLIEQIEFGYSLLGVDTLIHNQSFDSLSSANMEIRQKLSKKHLGYRLLTDSFNTIVQLERVDSIFPRINDFAYNVIGPVLDKSKKMLYPEYFKDYTSSTATIKSPTLIITGTRDHAIGINHFKLFKFPNKKVDQIDGGHLLYYENNETFVAAVKEFVNKSGRK